MNIYDFIGPALDIGTGIYTSLKQKKAGEDQARAAEQAGTAFRPYAELGDYAAGELQGRLTDNALLGDFTIKDYKQSPGYRFELQEGKKAIGNASGARGGRYSGATLKALQRYSQDLAKRDFGNAYNRDAANRQAQYNYLAGPMSAGRGAQVVAQDYATDAAAARGAGNVASTNSLVGGLSDAYQALDNRRWEDENRRWAEANGTSPYTIQTRYGR